MESYADKTRQLNLTIQNLRAALQLCGSDAVGRSELREEIRKFSRKLTEEQMEHRGNMAPFLFAAGMDTSVQGALNERQEYARALMQAQREIALMTGV